MFATVVPPGYIPPPPAGGKVERRGSISRAASEVSAVFAELEKKKNKGFKGFVGAFLKFEQDAESYFEREKQKRLYYQETQKILDLLSSLFETQILGEEVRDQIVISIERIKWWNERFRDGQLCTGLVGYDTVKAKLSNLEHFMEQCLTDQVCPGDINQALQDLEVAIDANYRGFILEIPDHDLRRLFN
eukprot:TRINITY_DN4201_c0_g1_i1.p2 TRINITY_DN4201_c0_g1~~TRINITY_DN4201_c0_g1_i1.p2  ORF type:complete len:205 (+),score=35.33 TRINITY_DN4201_c0_g1_i1:49-615(+)